MQCATSISNISGSWCSGIVLWLLELDCGPGLLYGSEEVPSEVPNDSMRLCDRLAQGLPEPVHLFGVVHWVPVLSIHH